MPHFRNGFIRILPPFRLDQRPDLVLLILKAKVRFYPQFVYLKRHWNGEHALLPSVAAASLWLWGAHSYTAPVAIPSAAVRIRPQLPMPSIRRPPLLPAAGGRDSPDLLPPRRRRASSRSLKPSQHLGRRELVGTERTDVKPDAESKFRGEEQRRAADGDVGEGGGWACLDTFFFTFGER